jgi:hypothetical protein
MNKNHTRLLLTTAILAIGGLALSACSENSIKSEAKYPTGKDRNTASGNDIYDEQVGIFGEGGLFGASKRKKEGEGDGANGISVNSFLWRASLDTVSFMPLASADPFGGVILTDWHTTPEAPNERFKLNVFILSRELRSDGVRVRAFKQVYQNGQWVDAEVTGDTTTKLEDTILTRARQLRIAQIGPIED